MSMIYYHHGLFDKSFEIDFGLSQENPTKQSDYFNIIGRLAKTSSILIRTDEVKEYVNQYVMNENVKHVLPKLHLLNWYASHYPDEVEHNKNFEKVFFEIVQFLGASTDNNLPFTERIKKLEVLNYDSARHVLHQFHMSYQQAAPELRPAILEEYINKTPLKYYQDIMKSAAERYKL